MAHTCPTSSLARIVLQWLGLQKLTEVTTCRSPARFLRFAQSEAFSRSVSTDEKPITYVMPRVTSFSVEPTGLCHHHPKRTICRFRASVRSKVRTSKKRSLALQPSASSLPRAPRPRWLFFPPICRESSAPAMLRLLDSLVICLRNFLAATFLRSSSRRKK